MKIIINKTNKLVLLFIAFLVTTESVNIYRKQITHAVRKRNSAVELKSNPSPTPLSSADYSVKAPWEYTSVSLKISFMVPNLSIQPRYDSIRDYKKEVPSQPITRGLRMEALPRGIEAFDIDTATSINDTPFSWEGNPNYLIGKIENNASIETMFTLLKKYYLNPIYIEKIYLENLSTNAYIIYDKACYGSCIMRRMYIIPWNRIIGGKQYNNLSSSIFLGSIAIDENNPERPDLDFNLDVLNKLKKGQFNPDLFPDSIQNHIKMQDYVVRSIKLLP